MKTCMQLDCERPVNMKWCFEHGSNRGNSIKYKSPFRKRNKELQKKKPMIKNLVEIEEKKNPKPFTAIIRKRDPLDRMLDELEYQRGRFGSIYSKEW